MLAQMQFLTILFNTLRRENDNRIEEISKLAKKVGCSGEVKTIKEARQPEFTNDYSAEEELENKKMPENFSVKYGNICIHPTEF